MRPGLWSARREEVLPGIMVVGCRTGVAGPAGAEGPWEEGASRRRQGPIVSVQEHMSPPQPSRVPGPVLLSVLVRAGMCACSLPPSTRGCVHAGVGGACADPGSPRCPRSLLSQATCGHLQDSGSRVSSGAQAWEAGRQCRGPTVAGGPCASPTGSVLAGHRHICRPSRS